MFGYGARYGGTGMNANDLIGVGFLLLFGLAFTAIVLWAAFDHYVAPFVALRGLIGSFRSGSTESFTPEPPEWTPEQDALVRRAIAAVLVDARPTNHGWRGTSGGREMAIYQSLTWFLIEVHRRALTEQDLREMMGGAPHSEFNEDGSVRRVGGVFETLSGAGRDAMESLGRLGVKEIRASGRSLKVVMPPTQTPEQFAASFADLASAALALIDEIPGADPVAAPQSPPTGPGGRTSIGPPPSAPAA